MVFWKVLIWLSYISWMYIYIPMLLAFKEKEGNLDVTYTDITYMT